MKQGTLSITPIAVKDGKPAYKPYKTRTFTRASEQPKPETMARRYAEWLNRAGKNRYYVFDDDPKTIESMQTLASGLTCIRVSRSNYVFTGRPDAIDPLPDWLA